MSFNTNDILMKVELTVVGIRIYCGGEENYPQLFARLPLGCEVVLRTNRTGDPYPCSISVFDTEMQKIGSIAKTDRRFIELEVPKDGVLYANVIEHSAKHNCICLEAENTKGIKEPFLRDIVPESGEIVFAKTNQDRRMEQLADAIKSQLERFMHQDITEQQMASLTKVLAEYSTLCCISLDGECTFKRADIRMYLKNLSKKYPELQRFHDDILEQHKDLGRDPNDVKVDVYLKQYQNIHASATAKGKNGKSQVDEWLDALRFTHGGELPKCVIREEIKRLANLLSGEMMNTFIKCKDNDELFATSLYSLNYRLNAIYVLYTRIIKYNYLIDMLHDGNVNVQHQEEEETIITPNALPLPNAINTERTQTYFQKAIEKGLIKQKDGNFSWIPIGKRGGNSQLAYFCGLVFEYKHSAYGNTGTSFPEEELNALFDVTRMYSSLTQVHNAKNIQSWRRIIDELFI